MGRAPLVQRAIAFTVFTLVSAAHVIVAPCAAPTDDWPQATPEELGMDSAPLAEMFDFIRERQIPVHSIQIVRKGRLALDAYIYPYDGRTRHDVASVTKSITSTLVGLAIDRGHIRNVSQPILDFFPTPLTASADSRRRNQSIEHLLTMQSGWDCGFEPNEARLFEMRRAPDWIQFMLQLPFVADPGTRWAYCSGNCHVLSALLTRATGTNALAFAQRELFISLGIRDAFWTSDPVGNNHGWGDLQLHPRDMAKIGQLFLQRGQWTDRQIISENWVKQATRIHAEKTGNDDHYGYYWWVKGTNFPGMFEAVGRGGQRITVWPTKDLVVVFTAGGFEPDDIAGFILKSLKSDQPLPSDPGATERLHAKLAAALQPPAPTPAPQLPPIATRVSTKSYSLTANQLDFTTMSLKFDKSSAATFQFQRLGKSLRCAVGLDGVPRFSTDTLVELPFACKGRWQSDRVFLLELDRIAGISLYRFQMEFSNDANSVNIELKERSGLSAEVFNGSSSPH